MYSRIDVVDIPQEGGSLAEARIVVEFETTEEARDWADEFLVKGVLFVMDGPGPVMH